MRRTPKADSERPRVTPEEAALHDTRDEELRYQKGPGGFQYYINLQSEQGLTLERCPERTWGRSDNPEANTEGKSNLSTI